MSSHYEMLGVRETADGRAIRAAYLKRIKADHPDRARKSKKGPDRATDLNHAYFILRDPRRRLAYDLELKRARASAGDGKALTLAEPRAITIRQGKALGYPPPRSRKSIAAGVAVCAAIVGLVVLIVDLGSAARPRPVVAATAFADAATPPTADENPWVDRAMVDRAVDHLVRIRARGRAADAMSYSRHCFGEFEHAPSALLLDHCLAFDLAAARWRQGEDAMAEGDFEAGKMRARHAVALRRLALPGDDRLRELSYATYAALARRIEPADRMAAEVRATPAAAAR